MAPGRGPPCARVGRRVRHVGRPAGRELLAQRGDDLAAEDLELVEHGRQRQAGVVDEEQLALVVADVVSHVGVALDDLLRRPDGQWRLRGKSSSEGPWPYTGATSK